MEAKGYELDDISLLKTGDILEDITGVELLEPYDTERIYKSIKNNKKRKIELDEYEFVMVYEGREEYIEAFNFLVWERPRSPHTFYTNDDESGIVYFNLNEKKRAEYNGWMRERKLKRIDEFFLIG